MEQKKIIPGIHCDVKNCAYNDKNANCYASQIDVGPHEAHSKEETVCSTFRDCDNGHCAAH